MSGAVKDVALVPTDGATDLAQTFERMASNPDVDVAKLERLIAMHERILARNAQVAFNAAMTAAQREMRMVANDANNPQTRSRYASYAALDRALRPIYTEHGFSLSFGTDDSPLADHVRVTCEVMHLEGHSKLYHIDMPADGKGAKGGDVMTRTHATGSAVAYGMRYLLKAVWNIATGEADDDGARAGATEAKAAPDGFEDWLADMEAVAEEGTERLEATWKSSPQPFRSYAVKHRRPEWERVKSAAAVAIRKAASRG